MLPNSVKKTFCINFLGLGVFDRRFTRLSATAETIAEKTSARLL